ncbi:MAG: hypothetical protein HW407_722 [Bacteroidetes bacterium]|nr:hypothetical protein [Bacteroidota bacterium]
MVVSRGTQKFDRVTITLVPTADERSYRHVPSTFDRTNRTYAWRHFEKIEYLIVPTKISSREVKIDMFVGSTGKRKAHGSSLYKTIENLVKTKIESEWQGLKLAGISRPTNAAPPEQTFSRGTIEEILGTSLEE